MTDESKNNPSTVYLTATPQPGALWAPTTGLATERLRQHLSKGLSEDAFARIRASAIRILEQCAAPTAAKARRTGIVVGYVQSGKTMSMASVAAVARDNGFRLIIVLAGVTTILQEQSRGRFADDLTPEDQHPRLWKMLDSSEQSFATDVDALLAMKRQWSKPSYPDEKRKAVFITVMKNHAHLKRLAELLKRVDLQGCPALVIDDEADQAGLNTASEDPASTTHRYITAVRDLLPHHTYLQYTATPQAPLLISLIDMLSPEFCEILEPGDGYTGGQAFFGPESKLAVALPQDELFAPGAPPADPPDGLKEALREFFVGSAVSSLQAKKPPWSMLIHPSQLKTDHDVYLGWTQRIRRDWASMLAAPPDDQDRVELVAELEKTFLQLFGHSEHRPPFADVIEELATSIDDVKVTSVNSENGDEIKWKSADAHILVGGEKLNRGFTVQGLTVTYMPRSAGGWNADTLQQRARFFGYKQSFIDRCRVHLHPDVLRAFRDYVLHEQDVRRRLASWRGRPLKEWKRAFFLEGELRPTRSNVLRDPFYKVKRTDSWMVQEEPHDDAIRVANRSLATALLASVKLEPWKGHTSGTAPLPAFLADFLVPYAAVGEHDTKWLFAARVWLDDLARQGVQQVRVVRMRGDGAAPRSRSATGGKIKKLLQGRSSKEAPEAYAGDASVCDEDLVTLQIHELIVKDDGPDVSDVVAIALHVPNKLSQVVVQIPSDA